MRRTILLGSCALAAAVALPVHAAVIVGGGNGLCRYDDGTVLRRDVCPPYIGAAAQPAPDFGYLLRGAKGIEVPNPMDMAHKGLELRLLQQQAQMQQMQIDVMQQRRAACVAALKRAVASPPSDPTVRESILVLCRPFLPANE